MRRVDAGSLTDDAIEGLIRTLRDKAFEDRATRLAAYVGGTDPQSNEAALLSLAAHLHRPDPADSPIRWADYRRHLERTRFAAVFTAHPTFSPPAEVAHALAEAACGPARACFCVAPAEQADLGGRVRPSDRRHPQWPRRAGSAEQGAVVRRPRAWPNWWTELHAEATDPVELGRLRHGRAYRYRLVGHAAAAAEDEAAPACAAGGAVRGGCRTESWSSASPAGRRSRRRSPPARIAPMPQRPPRFAHALVDPREAALAPRPRCCWPDRGRDRRGG